MVFAIENLTFSVVGFSPKSKELIAQFRDQRMLIAWRHTSFLLILQLFVELAMIKVGQIFQLAAKLANLATFNTISIKHVQLSLKTFNVEKAKSVLMGNASVPTSVQM